MTREEFLKQLLDEINRRNKAYNSIRHSSASGRDIIDTDTLKILLTSDGNYEIEDVFTQIDEILKRPDASRAVNTLVQNLANVYKAESGDMYENMPFGEAYAFGVGPLYSAPSTSKDWSTIISETAGTSVVPPVGDDYVEGSVLAEQDLAGPANNTIDAPNELLATLTDTLGNPIPLWIKMPNDEDGNQQWVPASKPNSTPLKVRKVDGVWTTVSIPESVTPLSEQWSGKTVTTNGAIYGIMQDGSRGDWLGNETPTPEQFSWGTISQGGKDYFIDKSSSDPWASRIEIGDTKDDDFRAQLQIVGTEAGYLGPNNTWNKLFDIPQADMTKFQAATLEANAAAAQLPYDQMTAAQQANADQARINADATRARDMMTAQQYDYQNQLGAAQEQRQRFQAAQNARQATAQLGLQAAQQTQQDFLTFNEILNNPQSALSSMNWMRGAVAPTEENRFGEDTPMNRLADFNKSRDMYNSYLSQMYSQPMPEMPSFNPASNNANAFMGTSIQNIINQQQAANERKIAEQNQIIADRDATIAAGFVGPTNTSNIPAANNNATITPVLSSEAPDSGPYVAPVFSNNPEDNPSFIPSSTDNRNAFLQRQAADRQKFFDDEARKRKEAETRAMAGMAGIGFRR